MAGLRKRERERENRLEDFMWSREAATEKITSNLWEDWLWPRAGAKNSGLRKTSGQK